MGEEPTRYLSTSQAAALLGLSPRTLEHYRVSGGGPPFLKYCNRVNYLRTDLDTWAVEGRRLSTSDTGSAEDGGRAPVSRADCASPPVETGCGRAVSLAGAEPAVQAPAESARPAAPTGSSSDRLNVRELAALLQVGRRTLDRYRARGEGPAFEKVDGRVFYARADVEAGLRHAGGLQPWIRARPTRVPTRPPPMPPPRRARDGRPAGSPDGGAVVFIGAVCSADAVGLRAGRCG